MGFSSNIDDIERRYNMEPHEIQTDDGYILTLLRISGLKTLKEIDNETLNPKFEGVLKESNKPAVLFVHGVLCSSEHWLLNSPDKALPFRLVDEGCDCWLANLRGTPLSRGHTIIPKGSRKYWDFSFHEMGVYDIPAMINHILKTTKNEKLFYIAHSMGCTCLFVCLSLKTGFQSKVQAIIGLGPAVYINFISNSLFKLVAYFGYFMGKSEFLRTRKIFSKPVRFYIDQMCFSSAYNSHSLPAKLSNWFINNVAVLFGGFGRTGQISDSQLVEVGKTWPTSTSMKVYSHGMQIYVSGEFRQYDFGTSTNLILYGQDKPPLYNLENITTPIATFYSDCDVLCPPEAVTQLAKEFPNLIGNYGISNPKFSHMDFLLGKDADSLVCEPVLKILQKFRDS